MNLVPPSSGQLPVLVMGLSPGWSRNSVLPIPFTWKKLLVPPPQHGHLYSYRVPDPVWSVSTHEPSPVLPLQLRIGLRPLPPPWRMESPDVGKPSSWAWP